MQKPSLRHLRQIFSNLSESKVTHKSHEKYKNSKTMFKLIRSLLTGGIGGVYIKRKNLCIRTALKNTVITTSVNFKK